MAQHMLLGMLVPILLVLGAPVTLGLRTLPTGGRNGPPGPREWLLAAVHSPVGAGADTSARHLAAVRRLLLRALLLRAVRRRRCTEHWAHVGMNLHFLLVGLLFFWPLVGVDPAPRRWPPAARLGIVFASVPFHAFFGVALMSANTVIGGAFYRALALPWVPDPLADQKLGGGLAWASGEIPLLLVLIALLVQWSRQDERTARRDDRRADADGDADLTAYNAMLRRLATPADTARRGRRRTPGSSHRYRGRSLGRGEPRRRPRAERSAVVPGQTADRDGADGPFGTLDRWAQPVRADAATVSDGVTVTVSAGQRGSGGSDLTCLSSPRVTFSSSTGRRSRTSPGSHRLRLVMVCGCLLRTQQCVELCCFFGFVPVCFCLFCQGFVGEFDPGSGRTLAACLTHASRAVRPFRGYTSGERVSNTWVTCPSLWDKPGKLGLIPDMTSHLHGGWWKVFRWGMGPRPISLLVG